MPGDPYLHVIDNLAHAILRGYTNEMSLDQKGASGSEGPTFDDPVKLRLGAWRPGRDNYYIAAISMDVLTGNDNDPTRLEKGFIAFKMDPNPTIELYLQQTKDTTEDATMKRVLRITASGVEFSVPTNAGGGGGIPAFMQSPSGQYRTQQQDDGNFVTYDMWANPPRAIWSAWSGFIG